MKVYEAAIIKFNEINKTDFGFSFEISGENYKKETCIKYGEHMINIETGESYYILKRDDKGYLTEQGIHTIYKEIPYVLSYVGKQNISFIEKLKAIKTRISVEKKAQKVLKR